MTEWIHEFRHSLDYLWKCYSRPPCLNRSDKSKMIRRPRSLWTQILVLQCLIHHKYALNSTLRQSQPYLHWIYTSVILLCFTRGKIWLHLSSRLNCGWKWSHLPLNLTIDSVGSLRLSLPSFARNYCFRLIWERSEMPKLLMILGLTWPGCQPWKHFEVQGQPDRFEWLLVEQSGLRKYCLKLARKVRNQWCPRPSFSNSQFYLLLEFRQFSRSLSRILCKDPRYTCNSFLSQDLSPQR